MLHRENHNNEREGNLGGFGESRTVWLADEQAPTQSNRPELKVERQNAAESTTIEALEKRVESAKEKVKTSKTEILAAHEGYNEKYTDSDFFEDKFFGYSKEKREKNPHRQPLENIRWDDVPGTVQGINQKIIQSQFEFNGKKYPFSQVGVFSDAKSQAKDLNELINKMNNHIGLAEKLAKAEQDLDEGHAIRLDRGMRDVEDKMALKSGLEEKPGYQDLEKDYNAVVSTFFKQGSEYKSLWSTPEGDYSDQRARENKNLFMSLLAQSTGRFETNFVLGNGFGQDPKENAKNFPFIHHEWLKQVEKWDPIQLEGAEKRVADKQREMDGKVGKGELGKDVNSTVATVNSKLEANAAFKASKIQNLKASNQEVWAKAGKEGLAQQLDETKKVEDGLQNIIDQTERRIPNEKPLINDLKGEMAKLGLHEEMIKLKMDAEFYRGEKEEKGKRFTREELSKQENRQRVMELALLQYVKAMKMVDQPYNEKGGVFRLLHPGVRQMMIASIYQDPNGVARVDGNGAYVEDTSPEYRWMIGKMAQSPYFNKTERGHYVVAEQRDFIQFVRYANLALTRLNMYEGRVGKLRQIVKLKDKTDANSVALRDSLLAEVRRQVYGPDKDTPLDLNNVTQVLAREEAGLESWKKFVQNTESLLANPNPEELRKFMQEMKQKTPFDEFFQTNRSVVEDFSNRMTTAYNDYNALEFTGRGHMNYFERLGMQIEAIYPAYQEYIKTHKELKFDQWDKFLLDPKGVNSLTAMFNKILPESAIMGGKADFVATLGTLHRNKPLKTLAEARDAQSSAINMYELLKIEIQHREQKEIATREGNKEALARLDGMTVGDKITDYAKNVIDMLIGPGQSLANRAAAFAILAMAWKAGGAAWKGKGKMGKALQVLFMAGAAELAIKQITGQSVLDRFALSGVADSLGGTYEQVLLEKGKAKFAKEDIGVTEHAATLMQLRNKPFSKVMAWYKGTDDHGGPISGTDSFSQLGISPSDIIKGRSYKERNDEMRARLVVKKTIENLFVYVANKEKRERPEEGMDILDEVYVKAVGNKDPNLEKYPNAWRRMPPLLMEKYRKNPSELTWQIVIQSEIDAGDIDKLRKQGLLEQASDMLDSAGNTLARWTRRDIEQPVGAMASEFWKNVDARYAPAAKNYIGEMGEKGARGLRYYKDKIEFEYENNKHTLRRAADRGLELIVTGAKLPFQILYAGTAAVVPWAETNVRKIVEILRNDRMSFTTGKLGIIHVIKDAPYKELMSKIDEATAAGKILDAATLNNYLDGEKNPEFKMFGFYQYPFAKAVASKEHYYETAKEEGPETFLTGRSNIGFYVNTMTAKDAGVETISEMDEPSRLDVMQKKAYYQAKEFFVKKMQERGLSREKAEQSAEDYMYPIHVYGQRAATGVNALHTFWRMPMPGSIEFELKEQNRWADYKNPNTIKFQPTFIVDPTKGIRDNLILAYGYDSPFLRTGMRYAGTALLQYVRMIYGITGAVGTGAKWILDIWPKTKDVGNWVYDITHLDEENKQWLDEFTGAAANSTMAISDLYQNDNNAKKFKDALDLALKTNRKLDLESVKGWKLEKETLDEQKKNEPKKKGSKTEVPVERLNPNWYKKSDEGWTATPF